MRRRNDNAQIALYICICGALDYFDALVIISIPSLSSETLCPGYHSRVNERMDLDLIHHKFQDGHYKDIASFRTDAMLLFDNAIK